MSWHIELLLFLIAFVAGTIDTIAGGGGLITLPAILATGLPPQVALSTSKLQSSFGVGTAAIKLYLKHRPPKKQILYGMGFVLIGACLGAYLALHIANQYLRECMPPLLLLVLLYTLFSRNIDSDHHHHPKIRPLFFYPIFGTLLGFYDGFLGPGTGAFWAIALVFFLGFDLKRATIFTKIFNFTSNFVSLLWFLFLGHVAYILGLCMALGQIGGGYLGAHLVSSRGVRLIRPVFIIMVTLLLIVLSYKIYHLGRYL